MGHTSLLRSFTFAPAAPWAAPGRARVSWCLEPRGLGSSHGLAALMGRAPRPPGPGQAPGQPMAEGHCAGGQPSPLPRPAADPSPRRQRRGHWVSAPGSFAAVPTSSVGALPAAPGSRAAPKGWRTADALRGRLLFLGGSAGAWSAATSGGSGSPAIGRLGGERQQVPREEADQSLP